MKLARVSTVPGSLRGLLRGQLHFLSQQGYEVIGLSSSGKALEEVAELEGIRTISVDMNRRISPIKDIISLFNLYKVLKKEKTIIVHSITPKAGLLSMLAAKMARVPIRIHTFTGLIFPTRKGFMQKLLINMDRLLCWAATNVYPEGEGVKRDLIRYKITKKPLKVLANGNVNGIDTSFFSPDQIANEQQVKLKEELNISASDFVFVFVGRLVKDKGINELVYAFSNFNDQNVKLLLVGPFEQDLDPLLPKTLDEINSNENIIYAGWQSDVRQFFAIADALVFPSYREGFPNVVMQAGAMGLPSIVTDINGCNEIIIDKENGVIIPPKDENKLHEAMQFFLDNPEDVERMANNSRKMIIDRFEQQVVWDALLEEYRRLEKELIKS
jgi:glycosyltransferase involved in cell wall biosynthesis